MATSITNVTARHEDGDTALLARIAWYYHRDGKTQEAIGRLLGMSRQRVMRALRRAQQRAVLEIRINHASTPLLELGSGLKRRFGLADAVVVRAPAEAAAAEVGSAAADYLAHVLRAGDVLGTSWGSTLHAVAQYLPRRPIRGLTVVVLNGALAKGPVDMNAFDLAGTTAERLGGRALFLLVPTIVDSPALCRAIASDRTISEVLKAGRRATKAIFGIGAASDRAAMVRVGMLRPALMARLRARGAVGDILGRFIDVEGRPLKEDPYPRTVGLDLDELRRIPMKICVVHGAAKVPALLGALRGGYIDALITDEGTARVALDRDARAAAVSPGARASNAATAGDMRGP
ncbi:MAG TPA: sugar-binding domain-containing protein [bacterium]|nr:sugar-binding domain-containing protein [bacterium]